MNSISEALIKEIYRKNTTTPYMARENITKCKQKKLKLKIYKNIRIEWEKKELTTENKDELKKIIFTQHYVSLQKLLLSSKKRSSSESSYVSSSKSMSEIQIKFSSTSVQESS